MISENITLCNDGKYRWIYEMNLYKDPSVFFLVWKIFFFIILGGFGVMNLADYLNWDDFFPDRLLVNLKMFVYVILGMTVLVGISCLIHAAINGGKYCIMFEMDENGVNHKQMPNTAKKSELIAVIGMLAGAAAHNPSSVAIGLAAARTEMYSDFKKVKKVKSDPRHGLIKVICTLEHNRVYAAKEDFDFVDSYIRERTGISK